MALFHIGSKGKLVLVLVISHSANNLLFAESDYIPPLLGTYVTVNLSDLQGTQ